MEKKNQQQNKLHMAVLKQMRSVRAGLRVVVTTAYTSMGPLIEVMGTNHSGFLVKPFELEDLGRRIDEA